MVRSRHGRRDWTAVSPHGQLVNVLFLNVKLPFCVAEGSRHLQMGRRQMPLVINGQKTCIKVVKILASSELFSFLVVKLY